MSEKETIQYYIQRLYDKNLTTMSGGNLSIKTEEAAYVTPSEVDKGNLQSDDIMEVRNDKTVIGKHRVTSEFAVHQAIYRPNPSVNAVLHSHTWSILGLSAARVLPQTELLADVGAALYGKIGLAKYADPGTTDLAEETVKVLNGKNKTAILENHGLFIADKTMEACYDILEDLDLVSRIWSNVKKLGGTCTILDENQLAEYGKYEFALAAVNEKTDGHEKEKAQLIELVQRLYKRSISTCKNACLSIRCGNGDILMNPRDTDVLLLRAEDICVIKNGLLAGGKEPHSDGFIHLSILENNPKLNCVITARPPYMMAYGCSEINYKSAVVPECYGYLRNVEKIPFMFKEDLTQCLNGHFDDYHNTVIVQNYLSIIVSEYPLKTYDRIEVAESTAQALIETHLIKEPVMMDHRAIEAIQKNCGIYPENKH